MKQFDPHVPVVDGAQQISNQLFISPAKAEETMPALVTNSY